MRLGQLAPEFVDIPSMNGIRVALVPLIEAESQRGMMRAAELEVPDNVAGIQLRNRAALESDVYHAMRDPENIDKQLFESVDTMVEELEPSDIDALADHLMTLMEYASPSIDGLSEEDLLDLKKGFAEIDLSVLTGQQWAAVKLCFQALLPNLLAVKLRGTLSTDSSMLMSENDESISDAFPSSQKSDVKSAASL